MGDATLNQHAPVAVIGPSEAIAAELAHRIRAAWCAPEPAPELVPMTLGSDGSIEEISAPLRSCAASVVLAPAGRVLPHLRRLISALEDRHTPTLLLLPTADAASVGAVTVFRCMVPMAATSPGPAIAGALHAVLLRQRTIVALHAEQELDRMATDAARRQIEQQEHETALAVMVQRAILPRGTPEVAGLEIGSIFRPGASLSGDIYDVVRLDDHHTGFFVADACGHGVAAAMLTMLVNRLLPMKEISGHSYRIVPPGEALSRFNAEFVRRRGELSTLITAVYGVIDSRTGNVTVAGAGHPPVVLSGPRGQQAIENNGPPAGVYDEYDYPQFNLTLAPDQTMLLYTDGFEVCFGHEPGTAGRKRFAVERYLGGFKALAEKRLERTMPEAVEGLVRLLDQQDGSLHQIDDITLLAVALDRSVAGHLPASVQRAAAA